jgi:hypothetical protein
MARRQAAEIILASLLRRSSCVATIAPSQPAIQAKSQCPVN